MNDPKLFVDCIPNIEENAYLFLILINRRNLFISQRPVGPVLQIVVHVFVKKQCNICFFYQLLIQNYFTQFAHLTPSFIIHALQVTVGHSHHNRRGTELTHNSNAVQSRNGKESGSERALVDG